MSWVDTGQTPLVKVAHCAQPPNNPDTTNVRRGPNPNAHINIELRLCTVTFLLIGYSVEGNFIMASLPFSSELFPPDLLFPRLDPLLSVAAINYYIMMM